MPLKYVRKFFGACINYRKYIYRALGGFVALSFMSLAAGKIYQSWDDDKDRGAIAIVNGEFGESYSTPVYLDQGWSPADSLWFYNTTQGSGLIPYDFFLALELADSTELFSSNKNIDKYRYLPQKQTFLNPDALPVGFTRDEYQGKSYIGYTCAACHTGQVNFEGQAIRIDGGPAMADMVGFLKNLEQSMQSVLRSEEKTERFVSAIIEKGNDYSSADEILNDLKKWTNKIELYNGVNHSHIEYGYARLDAFGRIYNRVLEHVLNKPQVRQLLLGVLTGDGKAVLTKSEVELVLEGLSETVVGSDGFALIIHRLKLTDPGYPGLRLKNMLRVRDAIFNEPDAPVSYPFLWGIAQSDYVQWNGLAANAGVGPIGRNAGEVIGVFGILDWAAGTEKFNLASLISGQTKGQPHIDFKSSINLVNLQRLENHLKKLKSPEWPEHILPKILTEKSARGKLIYARYCQSCHEVVDRGNPGRKIIGKMANIKMIGTDPAMVNNAVGYIGKSGNFKHTYQDIDGIGSVIMQENAPVVQILTAATKGVVATPDADKFFIRRWADWVYTLGMTFFNNDIKASIKAGNYVPDSTDQPYASLASYKARSLNGIWATAPYLHNGSVPTLYDLLLPTKRDGDPESGEYRPDDFVLGSREFDPVKVGVKSAGYDGSRFLTTRVGDKNIGHEYASGRSAQNDGTVLRALTKDERWDLIEFLKTL